MVIKSKIAVVILGSKTTPESKQGGILDIQCHAPHLLMGLKPE